MRPGRPMPSAPPQIWVVTEMPNGRRAGGALRRPLGEQAFEVIPPAVGMVGPW
ncbi:hypothetical protein BV133_2119 [Blastochloris viridis]|uniref:Uncharacterized protein n=1 Tax=Blastochloris viridis TaxID=1079 RepID=A0A182D4N4_BLAVI|nr:hypothetical protein BV133_2119 [Blastochloris viridis]